MTDGQTDGHRMPAIAALCIASHGIDRVFGEYLVDHCCMLTPDHHLETTILVYHT